MRIAPQIHGNVLTLMCGILFPLWLIACDDLAITEDPTPASAFFFVDSSITELNISTFSTDLVTPLPESNRSYSMDPVTGNILWHTTSDQWYSISISIQSGSVLIIEISNNTASISENVEIIQGTEL